MASTTHAEDEWEKVAKPLQPTNKGSSNATASAATAREQQPKPPSQPQQGVRAAVAANSSPASSPAAVRASAKLPAARPAPPPRGPSSKAGSFWHDEDAATCVVAMLIFLLLVGGLGAFLFILPRPTPPPSHEQQHEALNGIKQLQQQLTSMQQQMQHLQDIMHTASVVQLQSGDTASWRQEQQQQEHMHADPASATSAPNESTPTLPNELTQQQLIAVQQVQDAMHNVSTARLRPIADATPDHEQQALQQPGVDTLRQQVDALKLQVAVLEQQQQLEQQPRQLDVQQADHAQREENEEECAQAAYQ